MAFMEKQSDTLLKKVFSEADKYQWQCQVSYLNGIHWEKVFMGDSTQYFYPASTVKLPVLLLAIEKLNQLQIPFQAKYKVRGEKQWQTFEEDFIDILVLSGNESYNRLYDFVGGRDAINQRLQQLELNGLIQHRLSVNHAASPKVRKIKVAFNQNKLNLKSSKNSPPIPVQIKGVYKGIGVMKNGKFQQKQMDFSQKNYMPIATLQEILFRLVYPEMVPIKNQFQLNDEQRKTILNWMQVFPKEIGFDATEYPDNYVKFFLFGENPITENKDWQVFNKVGMAYGTLTDNAWIHNKVTKENFFLTATILVNQNEIFNDNLYEYESIGIPFLNRLSWKVTEWLSTLSKQ